MRRGAKIDLPIDQIFFPGVEVIDEQREMIAAIVRNDFARAAADQMQLLIDTQAKPGPGKS